MEKKFEIGKMKIVAVLMLFVFVQLSVNAQKGQKWAVDGNELSNGDFIGSTNNEPFIVKTNNNERLRVKINGNIGIGNSNAPSLLSVGSTGQFQVNSTGTIVSATGITSSGIIKFKGLTANSLVFTDADTNLTNTGIVPVMNGGTGTNSLNGILFGNGTEPVITIIGTENYIPKWSGGYLSKTSLIYDDGTNVGIGVNNPTEKLEVAGGLKLNILMPANSENGTIIYNGSDFLGRKNGLWVSLTGEGGSSNEWIKAPNGIYTNAGFVGVNTIPQKLFHIKGTYNGVNVETCLRLESGNNVITDLINENENFIIKHKDNESLTINSKGNVGIGVSNPTEKLEVAGCLKLNITTPPDNSANGTIAYNGTEMLIRKNNKWMSLMYVGPWDTVGGKIVYTNYNVGIGIVDPKESFEIAGAIRLGDYKSGNNKGDTTNAKNGTILYTGKDFLGKANNQWFSLTDGGTTPPPVEKLWDLNIENGTVFVCEIKLVLEQIQQMPIFI